MDGQGMKPEQATNLLTVNSKRTRETWDAALIALLERAWAEQLSAAAISRLIRAETGHEVSRCAVIGKARRLRLAPRGRGFARASDAVRAERAKQKNLRRRLARQARGNARRKPAGALPRRRANPEDADIAFGAKVGLLDLNAHTCRWPLGHPGEKGFAFCGAEPAARSCYCARHHALSIDPNRYSVRSPIGTLNLTLDTPVAAQRRPIPLPGRHGVFR
jgi:GcrA cell cycle regulator